MTKRTPLAALMIDIFNGIKASGVPVFQRLPDASQPEPFVSFGTHFDDDSNSGKYVDVITTDLQLDLYYPIDSLPALEDAVYKLKNTIKKSTTRTTRITSNTLIDNSIGRDVYHVVFIVTAYL